MIGADKLLPGLPDGLRDALLKSFEEIVANFLEHRWEPSELNGGKFCEVVFTIVNGSLTGSMPTKPSKPKNMLDACRSLENVKADASRVGDRSLRVLIPRVLPALYEVRNNRGVGHVGGDVDPNYMDATAVYAMASWVLAELVRIFHEVTTEQAQATVDALVERKIPLVWELGLIRRVLDPKMQKSDQVLLLLYRQPGWVSQRDLQAWIEYSDLSLLRTRVLEPLHTARMIEYDRKGGQAQISPVGVKDVEARLLKSRRP